ncbi:MAG: sulfurtransferase-like selenium metabolism protein YedF [Deltaproteobacteria bacterium]|nr:sulfurtransferase-like selenium metabolism protein YedF [Deltaproteobacteria bacterium]
MDTKEIDARGLACPQPVVLAGKAIDEPGEGEIIVLVDSETPRDNVMRLATSRGCAARAETAAEGFRVVIRKQPGARPAAGECSAYETIAEGSGEIVYLFDSDYVGSNRDLGKVLTNGFLNAALALPHTRCTIILISNGVRLATQGSYALEVLEKLAAQGFRILICGTCLDFFKIRGEVQLGTISNALEIMQAMTGSGKVITF